MTDALDVRLEQDRLRAGDRLMISFQRTLRIPDDGRTYPLPPGLGRFPIRSAKDYGVPPAWGENDFFIPMYQREALWISFDGPWWKPNAVKVGIGEVDALTGGKWNEKLDNDPQNYLVAPEQPWIDGINAGDEYIRQFIAMPLGSGTTVEAQITGQERVGGIQLVVFDPKPGRFPDKEPPPPPGEFTGIPVAAALSMPEMGVGAGGRMKQKIYPDRHGLDAWDPQRRASFAVHLVNTVDYREITGEDPPPTPVDAKEYTDAGLPWFDLYDEKDADIAASKKLSRVKSVREVEDGEEERGIDVKNVEKLRKPPRPR